MSKSATISYEFGPFHADTVKRLLLREGEAVPLTPKAFDLLLALVENRERVLEKSELMERLWPDSFVEETNLTQNISTLRKALGESPSLHQYVVTIPGRGYRFVASVSELVDDDLDLIVERRTVSRIIAAREEEISVQDEIDSEQEQALRSIAVLPFKSMGEAGSDEYLRIGMADALITRLSNIRQIIVRPTSAVLKYDAQSREPLTIGRELKVDSLLEGYVQKLGERVRVTVQLVKVSDGASLWAHKCDEPYTHIFEVQDSISGQVARALMLELTGEEAKLLAKRFTSDIEAYHLYLKGRYFWNKRTPEGLKKGVEYFEQAIEKDPDYAQAYDGLADCYALLSYYSGSLVTESLSKAKEALGKALKIDDELPEAHATLAMIRFWHDWDWADAEREYKRSIELKPKYATARHGHGVCLALMGRQDESIAELRAALELDPLSLMINADLGSAYYCARLYDEAIAQLQAVLEMDQSFIPAHYFLGLAYQQRGESGEAIKEFQKAVELSGGRPDMLAILGQAYAVSGEKEQAEKLLARLKAMSTDDGISPCFVAWIYTGLGGRDKALEWLERAYEAHSVWLIEMKVNPIFDSLRSDRRFADLLRRMGLAR